ncbi:MAG: hypothetical protein CO096_28575 [Armatimonadetes bacterium CG_4_9_14_3_um_filter_66_14]|nr:MAG: hypothetical protein COZ05_06060 [Armatimonadetes bacterium CG_4_10_14_3_um_filter_59_10]PJB61473.1 MAG: hypothetical protein CO096_28575 [Armatimonadetes bacterium CG_4_9_14_3_um_filter_66_14]
MKILVVSNLYPPHYRGGYELGCHDVVRGLQARGHRVLVLTSTYGVSEPTRTEGVWRVLDHEIDRAERLPLGPLTRFGQLARREQRSRAAFLAAVLAFTPDVVYFWNLANLSITVAFLAESSGTPVCYFVSDPWLANWEQDPWYALWHGTAPRFRRAAGGRWTRLPLGVLKQLPKMLLPNSPLALRHTQFTSRHLRKSALAAGKPVGHGKVIHWGIDLQRFPYRERRPPVTRLLYAGQVLPHKGVHTAVEALGILVSELGQTQLTFTIVGGAHWPGYESQLRGLVESLRLSGNVAFAGPRARHELTRLYHEHDVLLFPSIWEEPFGITPLEAMACGTVVVGTITGGSAEVFRHETNALVFPKEDARACARQLHRLVVDPILYAALSRNARAMVETRFTLPGMIDRLEADLERVARIGTGALS